MAFSPNWIITPHPTPEVRRRLRKILSKGRGKERQRLGICACAQGSGRADPQRAGENHEMGLSALQEKKKKWASLVVKRPGLVTHPTGWTNFLEQTGVITNRVVVPLQKKKRVVVFLWNRWIGRLIRKEDDDDDKESPRRRSQRVSEGSVGTCWSPRTEMLPARPALLLLCSSSSSSPTTRQQGSSTRWPMPAAWIPCSLTWLHKLNHTTCIKPRT